MLMSIDRRKKLLKYLRRSRYVAFEKVCAELGITYTFPPEYYRRATKRWLAKKALCIKVTDWSQVHPILRNKKTAPVINFYTRLCTHFTPVLSFCIYAFFCIHRRYSKRSRNKKQRREIKLLLRRRLWAQALTPQKPMGLQYN